MNNILGIGGNSIVYLVNDRNNTKYALKTIRQDKKFNRRQASCILMKEVMTLKAIGPHPNIIGQIDKINCNMEIDASTSQLSGSPLIDGKVVPSMASAFEYASNGTLASFIKQTGPFEEEVARFFMLQLIHAVNHIHRKEYVHLDIKPQNILLDDFFNIKLADFGSAVDMADQQAYFDKRRGTPGFMAPEIVNLNTPQGYREYDAFGAEMYSIGVTMYVILTGSLPTGIQIKDEYEEVETD